MENPDDDPRAFAHQANDHGDNVDLDAMPQGLAPLFGACLHRSDVHRDLSPHDSPHPIPDG